MAGRDHDYSSEEHVPLGPTSNSHLSPYSLQFDPSLITTAFSVGGVDYVFPESRQKHRSFGERICYGTGTSYLAGLSVGGVWGFYEGMRNPLAVSRKLKINSVLNGMTKRGPFLGNNAGVIAFTYNAINSLAVHLREEDNALNVMGSAIATGVLFKSTAGLRAMAIAGALGGVFAGAVLLAEEFVGGTPLSFGKPYH
eukprot:Opistho-1_new@35100